jgi:general stress protein YciG
MTKTKTPVGMTCADAGRLGGEAAKAKGGPEFYEAIGRKGGQATKATHGHDFYVLIGRKGGPKGGAATREKYAGTTFYHDIGTTGGARMKEIIAAGRAALATKDADG